jgi:hypothetical protein
MFYSGLVITFAGAFFFTWLWNPQHQIERHSENLLRGIEHKDWTRVASFIAADYRDQWGHDRTLVLETMHELFAYARAVHVSAINSTAQTTDHSGIWRCNIKIYGDDNEATSAIKQRVNTLATPFQFEWRRMSGQPWDWKLVRVSNPGLQVPSEFD